MNAILEPSELSGAGIDTVVVAGIDMYGRLFGKHIPVRRFDQTVESGLHVCTCVYAWDVAQDMDSLHVEFASAETGWHDFRLMPDLSTLRPAAWLEGTAICLADSVDEHSGEPLPIAPRTILRRQIEQLRDQQLDPFTATELEFHLYRGTPDELRRNGYRDLDPTTSVHSDYVVAATNSMAPFFRQVQQVLEGSGIPVEVVQAEYGLGQWEVNLEYADALETADRHVLYKSALTDLARKHGMTATFMPRPLTDGMGSSCHIHASVRGGDGGFPFYDATDSRSVSDSLRHAVGGVLRARPGADAVLCADRQFDAANHQHRLRRQRTDVGVRQPHHDVPADRRRAAGQPARDAPSGGRRQPVSCVGRGAGEHARRHDAPDRPRRAVHGQRVRRTSRTRSSPSRCRTPPPSSIKASMSQRL